MKSARALAEAIRGAGARFAGSTWDIRFAADPGRCPHCGSWDIEGGRVEIVERLAVQGVRCLGCGEEWDESYRLEARDGEGGEHVGL